MKNPDVRPAKLVDRTTLSQQWDELAQVRHNQIVSGIDLSFEHILKPLLVDMIGSRHLKRVLDLGCGTGELTVFLGSLHEAVTGVDMASGSIELARTTHPAVSNVKFIAESVEEFARSHQHYDCVVANMSLSTAPNLTAAVDAVSRLLKQGGTLVATIPHPAFWPRYWGYDQAPWFAYSTEIAVSAPFQISNERTSVVTTHFHRPLGAYTDALASSDFVLETLREPMPIPEVEHLYPEKWDYPRFLGFRARKQ